MPDAIPNSVPWLADDPVNAGYERKVQAPGDMSKIGSYVILCTCPMSTDAEDDAGAVASYSVPDGPNAGYVSVVQRDISKIGV